jgi:3-oxoacyl-[acyl-carrier protein] reductase
MNVLVTGANRGIGRALSSAFGRAGHRVAVNFCSHAEEAASLVEELRRAGAEAVAFQADVSDSIQARRLVDDVVKQYGTLDVLVNNAGISRDRTILKMTSEEWNEVVDVNLSGTFWCLQAAASHMSKRKEGCILNISSLVGVRGSVGNANYAAAKAGVIALTKAAARELGRFNIRVNAVLPGFHPTEIGRAVWEKHQEKILEEHVLGRLVDMEELASFIVNLSAQRSASGQVFSFESRVN